MLKILRSVLAVFLGLVVGVILMVAIELVNFVIYRPPMDNAKALERFIENAPVGALLIVLLAWTVAPFVGAWVAAKMAGSRPMLPGLIVGVFFLIGGVRQLFEIPHPLWFNVAGTLVFLPMAFLGARLAGKANVAV